MTKAHPNPQPTLGTEMTDNAALLASLKPGDRLRMTLEGEFRESHAGDYSILLDNGACHTRFTARELLAAKIELIPRPIKVGDWVTWGKGAVCYEVRFVDEVVALLRADNGSFTVSGVCALRHATPAEIGGAE